MKKIIYIISLFVSSVLYTSCDALDLAPEDYFGSGNYWNNEAQVDGYMTGMHSQLRSYYVLCSRRSSWWNTTCRNFI